MRSTAAVGEVELVDLGSADPHADIRHAIELRLAAATPLEQRAWELYAKRNVKLPAIPIVAKKLLPLLSKPDVEISDCIALIEVDRVLGAAMLRCANSAAFFRGMPVTSVRAAVIRIGIRGAAGLGLTISTSALFDPRVQRALAFVGAEVHAEWYRAALAAYAARDISAALRKGSEDLAFTVGLFHNIGQALAAFLLADLATTDASVAGLSMDARRQAAQRMRGLLMGEYVLREDLPGAVSRTLLELEGPLDRPISETAQIVRLTLGLAATPDLDDEQRHVLAERALEAARALDVDRNALDRAREIVAAARATLDGLSQTSAAK